MKDKAYRFHVRLDENRWQSSDPGRISVELQIRRCINASTEALEKAHFFLKPDEPLKAMARLRDAFTTVRPMLVDPDVFLLMRLVEIATWSSWKKFAEYEPVVFRCMAAFARDGLGSQHALTLVLGCFAEAAARVSENRTPPRVGWEFMVLTRRRNKLFTGPT